MAEEPFISPENRPELSIDLEKKISEITVRELTSIVGTKATDGSIIIKLPKDLKDLKDVKDGKDRKENKDDKDQKDNKDRKEAKEQKDRKDQKDVKDGKDRKDGKEQKDHKDFKEGPKELKEGTKEVKEIFEGGDFPGGEPPEGTDEAGPGPSELEALIERLSGLERELETLKKLRTKKSGPPNDS